MHRIFKNLFAVGLILNTLSAFNCFAFSKPPAQEIEYSSTRRQPTQDKNFSDATNSTMNTSTSSSTCIHDENNFRCVKYVRNYDGDTLVVDIPNVHPIIGKNIHVRVRHVDTPEMHGKLPCEKKAAREAQHLVENIMTNAKSIELRNVDKDKYFRLLADVIADGRDIKQVLFDNRLAYAYEGDTKKKIDWCERDHRRPAGRRF